MDITQLDQELRSNKIRPCYVIVGPERHLALSVQKRILKVLLADSKESPDRFQAGLAKVHTILDVLKTPAFLSLWRVVLVEEADEFKKQDWEAIRKFLEKPLPKATLILTAESLKAGDLKNLSPSAGIVECNKLYPRQVASWINMEVKHLGVAISQEAANLLAESVGTDLGEVSQALEKLLLYVGNKKLIQLEDVEQVVAPSARQSVFEMTNAIGEKKPERAVSLLENILEEGEEPLKAFALIARHFRILAKAQELLAKSGGSQTPAFAKELKVHPFFAKDYAAQARHFSKGSWQKRFGLLSLCDRSLKSSRLKPQRVLEKLVWDLCKD